MDQTKYNEANYYYALCNFERLCLLESYQLM